MKAPIEKLGVSISNIYCMNTPWGVAVNSLRREVVVTESRAHCVSVFSPRGDKLRSFGRFGFCKGQLDDPCRVAVDGVGSILVADCGNHRIQKFTNEGQFITAVGIKGSEPLHYSYPTDIALHTFNDKFYVEIIVFKFRTLTSPLLALLGRRAVARDILSVQVL